MPKKKVKDLVPLFSNLMLKAQDKNGNKIYLPLSFGLTDSENDEVVKPRKLINSKRKLREESDSESDEVVKPKKAINSKRKLREKSDSENDEVIDINFDKSISNIRNDECVMIIIRVSSQKQYEKIHNTSVQFQQITNTLRKLGYDKPPRKMINVYESGYKNLEKSNIKYEITEFIKSLKNKRPVIICDYIDRLSRNASNGKNLLDIVKGANGRIIFATCKDNSKMWYDTNSNEGVNHFKSGIEVGESQSMIHSNRMKEIAKKRKLVEKNDPSIRKNINAKRRLTIKDKIRSMIEEVNADEHFLLINDLLTECHKVINDKYTDKRKTRITLLLQQIVDWNIKGFKEYYDNPVDFYDEMNYKCLADILNSYKISVPITNILSINKDKWSETFIEVITSVLVE